MEKTIHTIKIRRQVWGDILRPCWWWLVILPLGVLSAIQIIREAFLSLETQQRFKPLNYIPDWPWWTWAILVLLTIIAMILERAYRRIYALTAISVDVEPQLDGKLAYLKIINSGLHPTQFYAKMLPFTYLKEGQIECPMKRGYYLRWGDRNATNEPPWKEIGKKDDAYLHISRLGGESIDGRSSRSEPGAEVIFLKSDGELPQVNVDMSSIIEFDIEIYSKPATLERVIKRYHIQIERGTIKGSPKWKDFKEV